MKDTTLWDNIGSWGGGGVGNIDLMGTQDGEDYSAGL
jgi:hypothetical protein